MHRHLTWLLVGCASSTAGESSPPPPDEPCRPGQVDLCRAWCDRGDGEACRHVGLAHARGDAAKLHPEKARHYLECGCDNGDPASCGELANLVADRAHALELHRQACDGGHGRSCFILGSAELSKGRLDDAKAMFRRGCDLGEEPACTLAEDVEAFRGAQVEDCPPGDAAACESRCEMGSAKSCAELARILEAGKREKEEILKAIRFHELACAGGNTASCASLGRRFLAGDGVPKDVEQARRWLELGCSLGDADSCELAQKWSTR